MVVAVLQQALLGAARCGELGWGLGLRAVMSEKPLSKNQKRRAAARKKAAAEALDHSNAGAAQGARQQQHQHRQGYGQQQQQQQQQPQPPPDLGK